MKTFRVIAESYFISCDIFISEKKIEKFLKTIRSNWERELKRFINKHQTFTIDEYGIAQYCKPGIHIKRKREEEFKENYHLNVSITTVE